MMFGLGQLFKTAHARAKDELEAACRAYSQALQDSRDAHRRGDSRDIGKALKCLRAANRRRLEAELRFQRVK